MYVWHDVGEDYWSIRKSKKFCCFDVYVRRCIYKEVIEFFALMICLT
jgi:hypothetical protein